MRQWAKQTRDKPPAGQFKGNMVRLGKEPAVTYEITDTHAMFVKGSQPR